MNPLVDRLPIAQDPSRHPYWPVIHNEYLRGAPYAYIAQVCNLSVSYTRQLIYTMVNAGRLERRPRHRYRWHHQNFPAIAAARRAGATMAEVCRQFRCSRWTVYRALKATDPEPEAAP